MQKYEDIYKRIYAKTLKRKTELSKVNNIISTVFAPEDIETKEIINFSKNKKDLLLNSSVVYLYEDVLSIKTILDRKTIVPNTIYNLSDFITNTKVCFLVMDDTGLIDPNIIKVYITGTNKVVIIVNKIITSSLSVSYLKGIYSYGRYDNNIDVVIPNSLKNSFMVWTKLPGSDGAAIEWVDTIADGGETKVPIRAQGGFSVLIVAEDIRLYKLTPETNSQFSSISFPDEIGYTALSNIFIWRDREAQFTQPIFYTPLYDGFKVEDVYRTSLVFDGATGYVSFGSFPAYSDITIHLRVKINTFGEYSQILQRGNTDGKGWSIRTTSDNRIAFQYKQYDSEQNVVTGELETGTWYDIVATGKNSTTALPKIYVNKVLQSETPVSDIATDSDTDELVMGRQANDSSDYADIEVDMLQIFDKVLRLIDIVNISNGVPIYTNLKHRWLMNENDGTIIVDDIGSADGELINGVEWNKEVDNECPRLVAFSKGIQFVGKYEDLLHKYNEYKDYMDEFLSDSLPEYIKEYEPYEPDVNMDTPISDFQDEMIEASRDFPNFLKEYFEQNETINFRSYDISDINPEFTRSSSALSVDGKYTILGNDAPRYIKNSNIMKRGLIIEEDVSNKISDPLFENSILTTEGEELNSSNWSISQYDKMLEFSKSVSNKTLRHTAFNNNNGAIRLNTPSMEIDKLSPLTVEFKIKYIKNTGIHELWAYGTAVGDSGNDTMNLGGYLYTTNTDENGFIYKQYRIPPDTFSGSGDEIAFGLWGEEDIYDEKDYFIKEFQVTNKEYGGLTFTSVDKDKELLRVPSKDVLNPAEGSFEIWFTSEVLPSTDVSIVQTNNFDAESEFKIYIHSDGSLVFAIAGSHEPSKVITSEADTIQSGQPYYVCMTWGNKTLYAYINGQLIGSASVGSDAIIGSFFFICADYSGNSINNSIVHDVRISNKRRLGSEILSNYNNKNELEVDEYTTYKLYYDDFSEELKLPNSLMHPTKLITNHDLRKRLLFINGLNISPEKCSYNVSIKKWFSWFRANGVRGNKIVEVGTGGSYFPYFETKTIESNNVVLGPSSGISNHKEFDLFEYIPASEGKQARLELIDPEQYTLSIDENIVNVELEFDKLSLISNYTIDGNTNSIAFSPDDEYVAIVDGGTLGLALLKIDNDSLTLVSTYELTDADSISFSPDGRYIAIAHNDTYDPVLTLLERDGDSVSLVDTYTLSESGYNISFSPDSQYIAIVHQHSPYFTLLKIDGNTLTLAATYDLGGSAYSVVFSPDGEYMAVGEEHYGLTLLKRNGDTISLADTRILSASGVDIVFSPDGKFITVGYMGPGVAGVAVLERNGDELMLINDYDIPHWGYSLSLSPNGQYVLVDEYESPFFNLFKINGDIMDEVDSYDLPNGNARYCKFSNNGNYVALSYTSSPYFSLLKFIKSKVGNQLCICERKYNQVICEGYSYDGLIQNLPAWVSFVPKERMLIFLNGRLLEQDRYYLFDPFRYTIMKGDTAIATDLDTNTLDGEIFNGYFTTELELIEYNVELVDGTEIITLNDKDFPFSKKYNLIFVDGRLIYPEDIKEIDNYRFSINTISTNNMCIFRKKIRFADKEKFSGIEDKWTQYLKTLEDEDLIELIGPLNKVNSGEVSTRSVYLTERHLFEILYHYCMKGRESLTEQDEVMIPIELPGTMLEDGRIPISTMRSGPYPRYPL